MKTVAKKIIADKNLPKNSMIKLGFHKCKNLSFTE